MSWAQLVHVGPSSDNPRELPSPVVLPPSPMQEAARTSKFQRTGFSPGSASYKLYEMLNLSESLFSLCCLRRSLDLIHGFLTVLLSALVFPEVAQGPLHTVCM